MARCAEMLYRLEQRIILEYPNRAYLEIPKWPVVTDTRGDGIYYKLNRYLWYTYLLLQTLLVYMSYDK